MTKYIFSNESEQIGIDKTGQYYLMYFICISNIASTSKTD